MLCDRWASVHTICPPLTSTQAQALFAAAEERNDTDWMEVAGDLQRRVPSPNPPCHNVFLPPLNSSPLLAQAYTVVLTLAAVGAWPRLRRVLRESGVPDDARWLLALRTATHRHPELSGVPLYVRFNRAERGPLWTGDLAPDAPLGRVFQPRSCAAEAASVTSVHALADAAEASGRLLVLACGSFS